MSRHELLTNPHKIKSTIGRPSGPGGVTFETDRVKKGNGLAGHTYSGEKIMKTIELLSVCCKAAPAGEIEYSDPPAGVCSECENQTLFLEPCAECGETWGCNCDSKADDWADDLSLDFSIHEDDERWGVTDLVFC